MPTKLRMQRINERVKEILSLTLLSKVDDPRLQGVSVTEVKVDRELDYANVYVSSLGGQACSKDVIEGLNQARGYLKRVLSEEIDLRVMPKLRFFWDPSPERADRIGSIIAQIHAQEASASQQSEDTPADEDETDDFEEFSDDDFKLENDSFDEDIEFEEFDDICARSEDE